MTSADRAMRLLQALVVDDAGRRWGERATDVQRGDAAALLDPDGPRRHWIGRSRGYSKTDDLAAVTVAVLLEQLQTGHEAIGIAADRDQARLLIDHIRPIAARTPELRDALVVGAYDVRTAGGVRFECLAADAASAWGRSPYWTVVDELCQWPQTPNAMAMWEAISTAAPKVRGRVAIITTAGDPSHWSRGVYEHAVEDLLWRVSEVHGPAPWLDPEELASERRRLPDSAWQRFFENRWCATEDRLLSLSAVHLLERPVGSSGAPWLGSPGVSRWDPDGSVFGPRPALVARAQPAESEPDEDEDQAPPSHYVAAYKNEALAREAWNRQRRKERERAKREKARPAQPFGVPRRPSRWSFDSPRMDGPGGGW